MNNQVKTLEEPKVVPKNGIIARQKIFIFIDIIKFHPYF